MFRALTWTVGVIPWLLLDAKEAVSYFGKRLSDNEIRNKKRTWQYVLGKKNVSDERIATKNGSDTKHRAV